MELFSLRGKVAFVTGASRGLGQANAIGLAIRGANVNCSNSRKRGRMLPYRPSKFCRNLPFS